jgi:hypothetical protein
MTGQTPKKEGQEYTQWRKNIKTKKTKQGRTGVRDLDKYSDCPRVTELTGTKNARLDYAILKILHLSLCNK